MLNRCGIKVKLHFIKGNLIISADIRKGNYLAIEQDGWLDNFHIQEFLALDTFKAQIHVSLREFSNMETIKSTWSLFFHQEMTWLDLIEAVAAEMQLAQE